MHPNLIYLVATVAGWLGWILVIRIGLMAVALRMQTAVEKSVNTRAMAISAVISVLCFAASLTIPTSFGPKAPDGSVYQFRLVWFVMPFPAWLGFAALMMLAIRAAQAALATMPEERKARLGSAAVWAGVMALSAAWYFQDKTSDIQVLRGSIPFDPKTLAITALLVIGGAIAMALAAQQTASRTHSRTVVTQMALVAGSLVFGLPFAFLLITSFKEDRDMASPNGIIWVPKVSLTKPYLDPKNPLFEVAFQGQTVQATILDQKPDGTVMMDIFKPLSLRGTTLESTRTALKEIPRDAPIVTAKVNGVTGTGIVIEELDSGARRIQFEEPDSLKGQTKEFPPTEVEPVRRDGLRWQNYPDALSYLPPETMNGLVYLKNTLILVFMGVIGTVLSCSLVAYGFSRLQFPGRDSWFAILLATMMLPGAVTLLPQFLIFRSLGWIDTLYPLWVPAFFASAFNVFLLRQFFRGIPMELEDASKIDGCSYLRAFWSIMLPQIKPALAVIFIWTFMGAWNNFMGPLIYINSPENMPLSYALQLYQGDRSTEPGLLMAFATMTMVPVLCLFFFMQKYFIEGVTLSGLGGR
jgi:multiple sugar transport system permease protein